MFVDNNDNLLHKLMKNADVIVYNRVPKTGSTMMMNILGKLANDNHFHYTSSKLYWNWQLNTEDEVYKNTYDSSVIQGRNICVYIQSI